MQIELDQLDNVNVHQLRMFARQLGVKSPTSLTKDILKQEILEILEGRKAPIIGKQGRPPKAIINHDHIYSINADEDQNAPEYDMMNKILYRHNTIRLAQDMSVYDSADATCREHRGYVEILLSGAALLCSAMYDPNETIMIGKELVDKYELKYGEIISVISKHISDDQPEMVTQITQIANMPGKYYAKPKMRYEELKSLAIKQRIILNNEIDELDRLFTVYPIYMGSAVAVCSDNIKNLSQTLKAISQKLATATVAKVVYINPQMSERDRMAMSNMSKIEIFSANEHSSFHSQQKQAYLGMQYVQRLVEYGKDVIVIVDNATNLAIINNTSDNDIPLAKQMLSLYKTTQAGSVTLITGLVDSYQSTIDYTVTRLFGELDIVYRTLEEKEFGYVAMMNASNTKYNILNIMPPEDASTLRKTLKR